MHAEAAFTHIWQVGRWSVELSIPASAPGLLRHAQAVWTPNVPGRRLTASEQRQYQAGLNEAIRRASQLSIPCNMGPA